MIRRAILRRRGAANDEPRLLGYYYRRTLELGYLAGVALSVLVLGAAHDITVNILALYFAVLAVLCVFLPAIDKGVELLLFRLVCLLILVVAFCVLQIIPGMPPLIRNPIWDQVAAALPLAPQTISVNPDETLAAIPVLVTPCLAGFVALRIFSSGMNSYRLYKFLTGFAAIIACLTLVEYAFAPDTLLFFKKWAYKTDFTLTFVNRNTAATFVGVGLCLNIGLLSRIGRRARKVQMLKSVLAGRLSLDGSQQRYILQFAFCAVLAIGLCLTRSRAGIASGFLAVIFAFLAMPSLRGASVFAKARTYIGVGAVILFVSLMLFLFFGGVAFERVSEHGLDDEARICTYIASFHAIQDNWAFGTGFGTFIDVFPKYRDPACATLFGIWERAHNSYIEFIMGVGVIGLWFLYKTFRLIFGALMRGLNRPNIYRRPIVAVIAALLMVMLHAAVDFSIQIPGFAIFFVAIIASGMGMALHEDPVADPDQMRSV